MAGPVTRGRGEARDHREHRPAPSVRARRQAFAAGRDLEATVITTTRNLNGLRAIDDYLVDHRYAISLQELAPMLGVSSKSCVHEWVQRMRHEGLVDSNAYADRTLHLTARGLELIGR